MDDHPGSSADTPRPGRDRLRPAAVQPSPRVPPVPTGAPLDPGSRQVRDAVVDLAARLGVDERAVRVVEARAVTWGDSSCGCPQPGMQYLQRLVDGAWVLLEVDGRRYDYRGASTLRWCAAAGADATRAGRPPDAPGADPP